MGTFALVQLQINNTRNETNSFLQKQVYFFILFTMFTDSSKLAPNKFFLQ